MNKLTGQGGPGRGQGRHPKPEGTKYRGIYVKLPPEQLEWLAANVDNRNGFIVAAVGSAITKAQLTVVAPDGLTPK